LPSSLQQLFLESRGEPVVLTIKNPGTTVLSDGTETSAVKTWDEPDLPRSITYTLLPVGQPLGVFNKYRTYHHSGFVTEDNFTGNAGMAVTELGPAKRLYECSNGSGPLSLDALVFELSWKLGS
jgi:hypothetical protein